MTNVIATIIICVVTNVSEFWDIPVIGGNIYPCENTWGGSLSIYIAPSSKDECRIVTEVLEQTRARLKYCGTDYDVLLEQKTISKTEKRRRKKTVATWEDLPEIDITPQNITQWTTNVCVTITNSWLITNQVWVVPPQKDGAE